jgi:hypothetical protein
LRFTVVSGSSSVGIEHRTPFQGPSRLRHLVSNASGSSFDVILLNFRPLLPRYHRAVRGKDTTLAFLDNIVLMRDFFFHAEKNRPSLSTRDRSNRFGLLFLLTVKVDRFPTGTADLDL